MRIEFITAESPLTRQLRDGELIRFPQLTVPLLAALTPPDIQVHHTDEIISEVDYSRPADLVAITCSTPAAPHAYEIARRTGTRAFRWFSVDLIRPCCLLRRRRMPMQ